MAALATKQNLDAKAQDVQLRVGIVMVAIALGIGIALRHADVGVVVRSLVFIPLFVGAYGLQAGLFRVCGITALRGRRISDGGTLPVADSGDLAAHRRIGVRVMATSAAFAALGTALLAFAR